MPVAFRRGTYVLRCGTGPRRSIPAAGRRRVPVPTRSAIEMIRQAIETSGAAEPFRRPEKNGPNRKRNRLRTFVLQTLVPHCGIFETTSKKVHFLLTPGEKNDIFP